MSRADLQRPECRREFNSSTPALRISTFRLPAQHANVAAAASTPGAVVERPQVFRDGPPEEIFFIVPPLLAVVFFPIAIAYARRIWKRSSSPQAAHLPSDLSERLSRLEAMGETTALEVERIGEGQRFVTRILTERENNLIGQGERLPVR